MRKPITVSEGERYGRLTVLDPEVRLPLTEGQARHGHKQGPRGALVVCDCGNQITVRTAALVSGKTQSCGCYQQDRASEANIGRNQDTARAMGLANRKHGDSGHYLYNAHRSMMRRCYDPGSRDGLRYQQRGITVYPDWFEYVVFAEWIRTNLGERPEGYSLDRIDNLGNYEPGNVRWASAHEQRMNQERMK